MQCPEYHVDMDPAETAILIPQVTIGFFYFKDGMIQLF